MKRIITVLLLALAVFGTTAYAGVDISAECAIVIDAATGRVILDRNPDEKRPMASTTKIMTAVVALENSKPTDVVTMTASAIGEEGSSVYLEEGDTIAMGDMLYGVMLNSGNDGAAAVAEEVAGSVESFVALMNEKAQELGLENTHFQNPNGLDAEDHYTTARDLANLTRYAMKNPDFAEIVKTSSKKAYLINKPEEEHWFVNHNKLLNMYDGCKGVKTGYTKQCGRCLVSAAERFGMTFIAVTLNDNDDWNDHMKMLDYAFNNYVARTVVADGQIISNANVNGVDCELIAADSIVVPVPLGDENIDTVTELHCPKRLRAPIEEYEKLGYVSVYYNGEEIGRSDVIAGCSVGGDFSENASKRQTSFYTWFKRINSRFFKL